MASFKYHKHTRKAEIQFYDRDRKRRTVRLSDVTKGFAERFQSAVEKLNQVRKTGGSVDNHTADFVRELGDVFFGKLVKVGLIEPRPADDTPAEKPDVPEVVTLGPFLDRYLERRSDVKDGTRTFYGHTRRNLLDYFGADKSLSDITEGDADDFRRYLLSIPLASATVNRRCGVAKTFFRAAVRHRHIGANPFHDLEAGTKSNSKRQRFIECDMVKQIMEFAPDAEWRLLIALARYGGLRIPSEALSLKWTDIDWQRQRILVTAPKTEHHEGRDTREIPIFPELVEPLHDAWDAAEPGDVYVITRHRPATIKDSAGHWRAVNLRTQFKKIIERAGVKPWPRLWQNLRSSRETELCREHPLHVVCAWIGNTERIAARHYLQITDDDYAKATSRVMPSVMLSDSDSGSMESQREIRQSAEDGSNSSQRIKKRPHARTCDRSKVGGTGPEHSPVFSVKTALAV